MGRRSIEDSHIRSITKSAGGRSFSVTLPMEIIKQLDWRARQRVVVQLRGNKIIIEDWKPLKRASSRQKNLGQT